ncbi:MAG: Ig-like domain-containing protein [Planctomycetota bacterium]
MKRKTWIKYMIFLISYLLAASTAFAGAVHTVDMSSVVSGNVVQKDDLFGWTSTMPEEDSQGSLGEAQFVPVDLSQVNATQGAFRVVLERATGDERSSHIDREAIISFIGEDRPLATFNVIWDERWVGPEGTYISINYLQNAKRDGLWPNVIPLGRTIRKGQRLELLFVWGQKKSDNALYIDGRKLNFKYDHRGSYKTGGPSRTFSDQLVDLQGAILGLELYDGNWNPANDTIIWEATFYDDPGDALDSYRPAISSVTHDAFAVAGYSGKLVEGDTYTVTLKAESGGTATFDLVQPATTTIGVTTPEKIRIASHAMKENPDNPGTYTGIHIVKYGEDVEDGLIVGHYANKNGVEAEPAASQKALTVDTKVYMEVKASNDLIPADENSRAGVTIVATDANGKHIKEHQLELTMSTTDEYTGIVGGGTFEDMVGGEIEVDWRGVTDSFGEVTAQYISGFAAKTILVSAKDMVSGDVGVGYVRSYIEGTVDVLVKNPAARALAVAGSMEVSLSRDWLTADGRSRSRITAVVKDVDGNPLEGDEIAFTLIGDNGKIRAVKSRTDSRGRAFADYIAGIVIGQVQIEVRDMTSGLVAVVSIELRPDAPAEISLTAEPAEIYIGDADGSLITAKVTDANGNPNANTDVLYEVITGGGSMSADSAVTDEKDGIAEVSFLPGDEPGVSTIKATVMSRPPTEEEIAAAEGAIFLYGLDEEPIRLEVLEWLAEPEDEVVEGQDLVVLEDRRGDMYIVKAPRDGILSVFTAEERDRVEYGQTLGYVLPLPE